MRIRSTAAVLALGIFLGTAGVQIVAAIPTSPAVEPTAPGIIGRVNEYLGNFLTLYTKAGATSELQFMGKQSWTANSNVATTMTSLGPQGASTTVSKWLVIVDDTGADGAVPWYKFTH
jgi:hypothetical protein